MQETLEDLKTRRSCRKYSSRPVEEEKLKAILEAGTYAPTGMGMQSPVMVVVRDKELIQRLSRMNAAVGGMSGDPFYGAGTVIVVFADKNRFTYVEDGSLVMGNLLNAAHALGVDSCWIHRAKEVFRTEEGRELRRMWGLDDRYEGIGHCILGYGEPDGFRPMKPRKDDYIIYA